MMRRYPLLIMAICAAKLSCRKLLIQIHIPHMDAELIVGANGFGTLDIPIVLQMQNIESYCWFFSLPPLAAVISYD
jgi:hypothetical protein